MGRITEKLELVSEKELIKEVSTRTGHTQAEIKQIVDNLVEVRNEKLLEKKKVKIFGMVIEPTRYEAESGIGKNLQTGEEVPWSKPERRKITVSLTKSIKDVAEDIAI